LKLTSKSIKNSFLNLGSLPPAAGVKAARGKKTSADDVLI
jgi:hypothetical protein